MPSELLIALRLSKEGFGSPTEILEMPTDLVLAADEFSRFCAIYRETTEEMNRPAK